MLPKEFHQLKYESLSVPQGSVRLVKKTQERKSSTCYFLITKGVTSSSPVPLKTRRVWGKSEEFTEYRDKRKISIFCSFASTLTSIRRYVIPRYALFWSRSKRPPVGVVW
ncbi:uncharacterized protein TNCV_2006261 [Trichonephila clavipes]|nr:uncharacterized protein TNCV_2006261 [Trichonephila clavipes]